MFHKLPPDVNLKTPSLVLREWTEVVVEELNFQVAAVYSFSLQVRRLLRCSTFSRTFRWRRSSRWTLRRSPSCDRHRTATTARGIRLRWTDSQAPLG
ncbi:hypothetical protein ACFL5O_00535 [Myxococcota bacterium]